MAAAVQVFKDNIVETERLRGNHGKVIELGTHDELMAAGGRYHTMFELQASRFGEEEGVELDASA